jgi:ribosomal protein S18 acetylase RimI-like enzyme
MLIIRSYHEDDLERVLEITLTAWEPVFTSFRKLLGQQIFSMVYPDWREEKRHQLTSQCNKAHGENILIAELDSNILGYAIYYCNQHTSIGEISHNAVDPLYQNQGIATTLYRVCLAEMKARGMTCAQVGTGGDHSHAPARRAYEKAGFDKAIPSVTYFMAL